MWMKHPRDEYRSVGTWANKWSMQYQVILRVCYINGHISITIDRMTHSFSIYFVIFIKISGSWPRFSSEDINTKQGWQCTNKLPSYKKPCMVLIHMQCQCVVLCAIYLHVQAIFYYFLSPPAERQSSVVVVRRHQLFINMLISQKRPSNFVSFLVYSFLRKIPMYCKNMDLA